MKQIIAMGGGGFSMEPDNLLLDHYILNQSGKASPRVCFLPTASGDSATYIARELESYQMKGIRPLTWRRYVSYSAPKCSIIAVSSSRDL